MIMSDPKRTTPYETLREAIREVQLDLAARQDCEEAFDLALYQDRGIELIEWDDAKGSCENRTITIRYLSRKLSADAVREAARSHSVRVRPAPPPAPAETVP